MLRERARHEDPPLHGHVYRKGPEEVNPQDQAQLDGSYGLGVRRMEATT